MEAHTLVPVLRLHPGKTPKTGIDQLAIADRSVIALMFVQAGRARMTEADGNGIPTSHRGQREIGAAHGLVSGRIRNVIRVSVSKRQCKRSTQAELGRD